MRLTGEGLRILVMVIEARYGSKKVRCNPFRYPGQRTGTRTSSRTALSKPPNILLSFSIVLIRNFGRKIIEARVWIASMEIEGQKLVTVVFRIGFLRSNIAKVPLHT